MAALSAPVIQSVMTTSGNRPAQPFTTTIIRACASHIFLKARDHNIAIRGVLNLKGKDMF
jgi:hypothetical protein